MLKYVPNILTASRFPISVLILILHFNGFVATALFFAITGCVTDFFDGLIARWLKCESTFGARVDPYADKMLCWTLTLIVMHTIWSSFALLMILSYPVVAVMALYDFGLGIIRYRWRQTKIPTNSFAKLKTTWLMVGLLLIYGSQLVPPAGQFLVGLGILCTWIAGAYAIQSALAYMKAYFPPTPVVQTGK